MAASSVTVQRSGRAAPVDIRQSLEELELRKGTLRIRLRTDGRVTARPREVLAALGLEDLELEGVHLTRTEVEIH